MAKKMNNVDREELSNSISNLEAQIQNIDDELSINPENFFPDEKDIPGLNLDIEIFDYDLEIQKVKVECKETLECLASLYLTDDIINQKNVYQIIQSDSTSLADLSFSLSMSKRALINLMRQIDSGINAPDMYLSVSAFQKEIRESIKMSYDLQKKMKDFYKDLKNEISTINTGGETEMPEISDETLSVTNTKLINQVLEEYKDNPDLLDKLIKKK
jgi:hypothetical protein